jgi:hypothetical protein
MTRTFIVGLGLLVASCGGKITTSCEFDKTPARRCTCTVPSTDTDTWGAAECNAPSGFTCCASPDYPFVGGSSCRCGPDTSCGNLIATKSCGSPLD